MATANGTSGKNKRGPRTSEQQFNIYKKFLEDNEVIRFGKLTSENSERVAELWEEITKKLNACGSGAVKSTDLWKKTFTEWRSTIRRKRRSNEKLKQIEKDILTLTGEVAATGLKNIAELGLPEKDLDVKTESGASGFSEMNNVEIAGNEEDDDVEIIYIEHENESVDGAESASNITSLETLMEGASTSKSDSKHKPKVIPKKQKQRVLHTKSRLAMQYSESVAATKSSLDGIAAALNNIANAIETGCEKIADKLVHCQL